MEQALIIVDQLNVGKRLDIFLAEQLAGYSRSYFKNLIDSGLIKINQQKLNKSGYCLKLNDQILVEFPKLKPIEKSKDISNLQVKIIYEHADFLIINKPAGLVVHAPQNDYIGVTLVDWLTNYFHEIKNVGVQERPGIVHRLDMHTSGIMIVPRNNLAHAIFTNMFKNRQISKTYLALVTGHPVRSGQIDYHIVRHPSHRNKMTHVSKRDLTQNWAKSARHAQTNYEVINYYEEFSLLAVKPVTGRTHQIRVHMAALGHVLFGDVVYGHKTDLLTRQALHAYQLEFTYQGQTFSFTAQLPSDMQFLIDHAIKLG